VKCRHRYSWLSSGGLEWCYQCGAIRRLKHISPSVIVADSAWCVPTGEGGGNPWSAWDKRNEGWRKAMATRRGNR
jgi:hypothetical protein